MSNIPTASEFTKMFKPKEKEKIIRFAKIDPIYASGRPALIFDGETVATVKKYPYLSSYVPNPNDRVMLIKNVIIGKII